MGQLHHPKGLDCYSYQPIKSVQAEIRILILHTGSKADRIECTLFHAELAEMDYRALSYEWGKDTDIGGEITINTLPHPRRLQRNLELALLEIRQRDEDILLWIDAICINQDDRKEKSQQVAMMGDIFRKATSVIAWIGSEADDSDLAMKAIADRTYYPGDDVSGPDTSDLENQALVALANRSYWTRIWVVQELHLAQTYVVQCGSCLVRQEDFEDSIAWANHPTFPYWRKISNNPAHAHRFAQHTPRSFLTLRWWIKGCLKHGFQARDERDYIYALISVSQRCRIVPDYNGTVRDTFLQAARFICRHNPPDSEDYTVAQLYAEKMGLVVNSDLVKELDASLGLDSQAK